MKSYSLVNQSKGKEKVDIQDSNTNFTFNFPCELDYDCTDYKLVLGPGKYLFELYAASGGHADNRVSLYQDENGICKFKNESKQIGANVECSQIPSRGGAGGYISGILKLKKIAIAYLTIGGKGEYASTRPDASDTIDYKKPHMSYGGYGGGGSGGSPTFSGGGGGQTSLSFEINDLWHRVLVSGAGGGADNDFGTYHSEDDGSGGSGGGLIAQGWWTNGVYNGNYLAKSDSGFTFGSGEAAQPIRSKNPNGVAQWGAEDKPGSGGGWFGGFSSHGGNSGSGGGSSWALTKDAIIPNGLIQAHDEFYNLIDEKPYAFNKNSIYIFSEVKIIPGVWDGNGKAIITILNQECYCECSYSSNYYSISVLLIMPFIIC